MILHADTYRITLLPVDLWRDTDDDRHWLPTFVLPRDPAVVKIIQRAQSFLACLADDITQGFDGYQSVDQEAEDPAAGVDVQAQAIWNALILDLPLAYINPPPSYEADSQRLRTPRQILDSGRGTCIDLSLLIAACLEFIDINPVIFLLDGHAFPGYWRSEDDYDKFLRIGSAPKGPAKAASEKEQKYPWSMTEREQKYPWSIGRASYGEIIEYVKAGSLVPIESTLLTAKDSFRNAVEQGHENLRSRREFNSMIDVRLARDNESNPVTPLPLGG